LNIITITFLTKTNDDDDDDDDKIELCTFDEALKFFRPDGFLLQLNLQRHEDGEEKLVLFVETAGGVRERAEREALDDVLNASGRDRRLGGRRHRLVEELDELA